MSRSPLAPAWRTLMVLVLAAGLLAGCGGDDDSGAATGRAEPIKASADALTKVAGAIGHPLYWAAGVQPATYELTQTTDGRVFIRYLPAGVEIGDPRPNFLTVGTYPQDDAFAAVQEGARRGGALTAQLPDGGLMVSQPDQPTSAFFSYPDSPVLVEVYDPTAGRAAQLIRSGTIRPIL